MPRGTTRGLLSGVTAGVDQAPVLAQLAAVEVTGPRAVASLLLNTKQRYQTRANASSNTCQCHPAKKEKIGGCCSKGCLFRACSSSQLLRSTGDGRLCFLAGLDELPYPTQHSLRPGQVLIVLLLGPCTHSSSRSDAACLARCCWACGGPLLLCVFSGRPDVAW